MFFGSEEISSLRKNCPVNGETSGYDRSFVKTANAVSWGHFESVWRGFAARWISIWVDGAGRRLGTFQGNEEALIHMFYCHGQ